MPEGCVCDFRSGGWILFSLPNLSSYAITLEFTKPLTDIQELLAPKATNLNAICYRSSNQCDILDVSQLNGTLRSVVGIALILYVDDVRPSKETHLWKI
jgi:hypothetical protein